MSKMKISPKRAIVWLFSFISISSTSATSPINTATTGQQPQWQLIWQDDFISTTLDKSKWTLSSRGKPDWKNTMSDDPRLLKIENGLLQLRGMINDKPDQDPAPFITAGITSKGKFSFQYGKVEIRARFKSAQGAWPALWMMGNEKGWPAKGEIDLMEHLNFDDVIYQTVHSEYTVNIDKSNTPRKSRTTKINRDDWNTYGVEWTADKLMFTVNGKVSYTYPRISSLGKAQWPFNQPFYFILSMQIGGEWVNSSGATQTEHYPADIEIDWVRVSQRNTEK